MAGFVLRRFFQTILILIIVSALVFLVMRLLPGDPIYLYMTEDQIASLTPAQIREFRHQIGLDKPMVVQYFDWMSGVVHGDLGASILYHTTVRNEIAHRLPITMYLSVLAFIPSFIIGIPMGVIAALRRGKWEDSAATVLANLGITLPSFWLAILLIDAFGVHLKLLPTFGYTSPLVNFWQSTKQVIMPVFCLTVFAIASTARQTRSAVLEVLGQDYIRTAWSKGLTERKVVFGHALKNSLIPVVTLAGLSLRNLVGGAVLIETVFSIPGMGRLAADAMLARDYAVVQGVLLILACVVCLANLFVDLAYGWLDPRIRFE